MPLIRKREWRMPNGERWQTWIVCWLDGNKHQRVQPFPTYPEAERFFLLLAEQLRRKKSEARSHG